MSLGFSRLDVLAIQSFDVEYSQFLALCEGRFAFGSALAAWNKIVATRASPAPLSCKKYLIEESLKSFSRKSRYMSIN